MKYCRKCILPDTRPGLVLDDNGVCSACRSFEYRREIDWDARKTAFHSVAETAKARSKGYDCVIPVSGGKDSTWQVVTCLEHDLKPLCVTWRTPGRTSLGQRNLDNLIALGVDHIDYVINPDVERRFVHKALRKYGIPGLPMHMALFNIPLNVAARFEVPLMVWGENAASEYTGESMHMGFRLDDDWIARYGVTNGTVASDWVDAELTEKMMMPYFGPPTNLRSKVLGVFLGYYFPWDADAVYQVAKTHGFMPGSQAKTGLYDYADIDDDFISVHHWLKWHKFGFTRLWDNLSLEIRNKRMSRKQAIQVLEETGDETPVEDIERFCAFLQIPTPQFFEICDSFRDPNIWRREGDTWVIDNFLVERWKWS